MEEGGKQESKIADTEGDKDEGTSIQPVAIRTLHAPYLPRQPPTRKDNMRVESTKGTKKKKKVRLWSKELC